MSAALALGTAQLGLGYGITGPGRPVARDEAAAILAAAPGAGFCAIDTAPHYGDAERLVGEHLPTDAGLALVTRTPAFLARHGPEEAARRVRAGLEASLAALRVERVHGLLVHVVEDALGACGDAVFAELVRAKELGLAERIGAVAYTADELDALVERRPIELVQVPLGVLDQRLIASGHVARLAEHGVEVHARSALAQGLLLALPDALPAGMERARPALERFRAAADALGRTPLETALGFALGVEGLAAVSVGVHSLAELREVAAAAALPPLDPRELQDLAVTDPFLLDPTRWPNALPPARDAR